MATATDAAVTASGAASSLSDEQILGIDTSAGGSDAAASGETPTAAPGAGGDAAANADPGKPADDGQKKEPDPQAAPDKAISAQAGTIDLRRVPEKYREMVRGDAELASMFSEVLGWRELGAKLEDVKALREALPEGLDGLTKLKQTISEIEETDAAFASGDPGRQMSVIEGMYAASPEAFPTMLRTATQFLARQDPKVYGEIAGEIFRGTLSNAGFTDEYADTLRSALADKSEAGNAARSEILEELLGWLNHQQIGLSREARVTARERALDAREQATAGRAVQEERRQADEFQGGVARIATEAVDSAINELLGRVLPANFPQGMRARVAKNLQDEISRRAEQDTQLQAQLVELWRSVYPAGYDPKTYKGGVIGLALTPANQQRIAAHIAAHGKGLVETVWREIGPDWTSAFASSSKEKADKAAAGASRVDITSSASGGANARPLRPKDIDYRKTTDEQILDL